MPSSRSVHVARFLCPGDGDGGRRILLPNVSLDERASFHAGGRSMTQRESHSGIPDAHDICRHFQWEIIVTLDDR